MALTTLEDVARHAKSLMSSDASTPLAAQWVNFRIAEVAGQKRLRTYRRLKELYVPAPVTTGTVTVTRDSPDVIGTGTAWTQTYEGWYLRPQTAWYRVLSVNSPTSITLESPFAENSLTDTSYTLVKRYQELPADVQMFSESLFIHGRNGRPLRVISWEELSVMYPLRSWGGGGLPQVVAEAEPRFDGVRQLEIYPYPSTSELYYYLAWLKPESLDMGAPVPPFINPYVLVEGIKVDMLFYAASREQDASIKQLLYNEHRRQATYWQGKIHECLLMEPGVDDAQFVVRQLADKRGPYDYDIVTAYDQVWFGRG